MEGDGGRGGKREGERGGDEQRRGLLYFIITS